jgi:hypothetical protein
MDEKPFLEFEINSIKDNQIEELKKFHKSVFDTNSIINSASELKYTNELKVIIQQELTSPTADFVKHFAKQVYPNNISAKVLEQFTNLLKKSIQQYVADLINERLNAAFKKEEEKVKEEQALIEAEKANMEVVKVVTTEEELEAFMIIKNILRQKVSVDRISYRDAQTYCAIILDDNNRKSICRLYLNGGKKFLATFDADKNEKKNEISSLDDIYTYADVLIGTVEGYNKVGQN